MKKFITKKYTKSRPETDIDILYKMLKEKKVLRLISVTKLFKINEATAIEWFEILEESNLGEIKYPTFGSPRIILIEKENEKKNKEEKQNKQKKD